MATTVIFPKINWSKILWWRNGIASWWSNNFRWWNARHRVVERHSGPYRLNLTTMYTLKQYYFHQWGHVWCLSVCYNDYSQLWMHYHKILRGIKLRTSPSPHRCEPSQLEICVCTCMLHTMTSSTLNTGQLWWRWALCERFLTVLETVAVLHSGLNCQS